MRMRLEEGKNEKERKDMEKRRMAVDEKGGRKAALSSSSWWWWWCLVDFGFHGHDDDVDVDVVICDGRNVPMWLFGTVCPSTSCGGGGSC